jgi:hypothetical protein
MLQGISNSFRICLTKKHFFIKMINFLHHLKVALKVTHFVAFCIV